MEISAKEEFAKKQSKSKQSKGKERSKERKGKERKGWQVGLSHARHPKIHVVHPQPSICTFPTVGIAAL
jgi:hypothetical protein